MDGRYDRDICMALESIALELREIKEIFAEQEAKKEKLTLTRMVRVRKPKKVFEI